MCVAGKQYLEQVTRFDMPGFRPRGDWVRELKRFGILTSSSFRCLTPEARITTTLFVKRTT